MKRILRKTLYIAAVLAATIFAGLILTAGIFTDEVKFKNVEAPFIDLDVMIEDLAISTSPGDEPETQVETQPEAISEFVIAIRETDIKINGSKVSAGNFEGIFDAIYKKGVAIKLVDDYAEYHTYKKVREYLLEKGLKPIEEKR